MAMKFYEYKELPAYWNKPSFPYKVTASGPKIVHELTDFIRTATPITEEAFKKMTSLSSKRAR